MIEQIIKQLWNKRRANTWIFLELILVTFFMWGVIDPVYVLLSNRAIEPGYDIDNVFRLMVGQYPSTHSQYHEEWNTDSIRKANFLHIYERVRNYPGIESAVITSNHQYPLSGASSIWDIHYDSLMVDALMMKFYQDGDFFRVFRIYDIHTGTIPDHHHPGGNTIYITESLQKGFHPEGSLVGQNLYHISSGDTTYFQVKGIVSNFKFRSTEQPIPTNFTPSQSFDVEEFPWSSQICFRIRDGLSKPRFAEQFKQDMASQLNVGNLYFLHLTDFDTIYRDSEYQRGITNTLRLQIGLAVFFLICTFLGIAGTFWLRSDARKAEIGLRMALGGSRRRILKEFLTECWLLATGSWLIGILFVLQKVYLTGFAGPRPEEGADYIQNQFVPHFLIVSLMVYILILFIAFVGTWIPARQAASIQPSDALRED